MGSEVLGDGKGGDGVDLLLAHDAHGFGTELVGVIDEATPAWRVESSGLAGCNARPHACLHEPFPGRRPQFGLGVLVGRVNLPSANGRLRFDNLDDPHLLELLPSDGDEFAGIVA